MAELLSDDSMNSSIILSLDLLLLLHQGKSKWKGNLSLEEMKGLMRENNKRHWKREG